MNEQILKAGRPALVAEFLQWPCEVAAARYSKKPQLLTQWPDKAKDWEQF